MTIEQSTQNETLVGEYRAPDALEWSGIQDRVLKRLGSNKAEILRVDPGSGSLYIYDDHTLLLDPMQLGDRTDRLREESRTVFEALHDGAHAMIARSPAVLGSRYDVITERYSKIGYAFTQAAIEDSAMNRWAVKRMPETEELFNEAYNGSFSRREIDVLKKYGIDKPSQMPRFLQYGFELLRKNQSDNASDDQTLAYEVTGAVNRTEQIADEIADATPRFIIEYFTKRNARKRFAMINDEIWPEAEKLVEYDIQAIMANLARMRQPEPVPEIELTPEEKEAEAIAAVEDAVQQIADDGAWVPEMYDIYPSVEPLDPLESPRLITGEDVDWHLWEVPKELDGLDITAIRHDPVMMMNMTHPLLELPPGRLKILRAEAEQILKDLEDRLVMSMRGQDDEEIEKHAPTHQEIDRPQYEEDVRTGKREPPRPRPGIRHIPLPVDSGAAASVDVQVEMVGTTDQLVEELREEFTEELDPWDQVRSEVSTQREALTTNLTDILEQSHTDNVRPTMNGFGRLLMKKAIALEMGTSTDLRIFGVIDRSEIENHIFDLWFDVSNSVKGRKKQESFKALVTVVDTLEALNIPVSVGVFGSEIDRVKEFDDRLVDRRDELAEAVLSNRGGTATDLAAQSSIENLRGRTGEATRGYVIFVTDGQPNHESRVPLVRHINALHKMGIPTIGVCVGEESDEIRNHCAFSIVLGSFDDPEDTTDFATEMSDVVEAAVLYDGDLVTESGRLDQ